MAAQEGAAGSPGMRVRYGADMDDSNFALHGRAVPLLVGLLCLVVVSVAVSLYLRWACRRRQRRRYNDPEATSSSSSSAPAPTMPGLDADAINRLPVKLYSPPPSAVRKKGGEEEQEAASAAECSICIVELVAGDKVKALPPCGHCFHPDCVDAWLRSQPSCPLCRTLLVATAAKPAAVDGADDSPV